MISRTLLFLGTILSLAGCTYFTNPKEIPVIEDRLGREGDGRLYGTLAITPERRVIFANFTTKRFCAEPPPDVAENITSSLSAAMQAAVEKGDISAQGNVELAKEFLSSADQIFTRTQGVQMFRDGMYSLCQAYANEVIDETAFLQRYDELLKVSTLLIQMELNKLPNLDTQAAQKAAKEAQESLKHTQLAKIAAEKAAKEAQESLAELQAKTSGATSD